MAKWPKMVFKKGDPEHLDRVKRDRYYSRIYDGWGVVTAAKINRRVGRLLKDLDMTKEQFWEFMNDRVDDLPISRYKYDHVLRGTESADSYVDAPLLLTLATASRFPLRWFTQDEEAATPKAHFHWDFDEARTRSTTVGIFDVTYELDGLLRTTKIAAYDKEHVRSLIVAKHSNAVITAVVEIEPEPGVEIG